MVESNQATTSFHWPPLESNSDVFT